MDPFGHDENQMPSLSWKQYITVVCD